MTEKRFVALVVGPKGSGNFNEAIVIDIPDDKYNVLSSREMQEEHEIVNIKIGGIVSKALAKTWTAEIADKLNSFDAANLAVAKLT
jgi:hypothetical protein